MEIPKNHLEQNFFERNPKKTLFIILIVTVLCSAIIADKIIEYKSRPRQSGSLRYVNLREYAPGSLLWLKPPPEAKLAKPEYLLRADDDGFIMPSRVHEHPDRTIAFLGGSTTECCNMEEEERFPYLAGRLLERDTGLKVNAYNAGVSSNNTLNSIDILINKVLPVRPKVVIMMHNINDLITLLYDKTYWSNNPIKGPILEMDNSLGNNLKNTWRQLAETALPYLYPAIFPPKKKKEPRPSGTSKKLVVDKDQLLYDFGANLNLFIQVCRVRNITPVLMTQANQFIQPLEPKFMKAFIDMERTCGVSYEMFKELYDLFNDHIRKVAVANKVLLVDLAAVIPQQQDYFYDVVHFTAHGSKKVAEAINEKVKPLLIK